MCNHENREAAMTVLDPKTCCDPCLTPLIKALNDGGLRTVASCCGHDHRPGSVMLDDGRVLLILPDRDWDTWLAKAIHERVGDMPGHEPRCTCPEDGHARNCAYHTQADFDAASRAPIATGVTTEDEEIEALRFAVGWWAAKWAEARTVLAVVADRVDEFTYDEFSTLFDDEPNDHLGETYAPAPVVSAGDEGVSGSSLHVTEAPRVDSESSDEGEGLREDESALLDDAMGWLTEDLAGRRDAAVERILAARVAEAGARILVEAADEVHREARWIAEQTMRGQRPDPLERVTVLERIFRAQARRLGGVSDA